MKVLVTSDLHNRQDWYSWLLQKALRYDGLFVSGDLINMVDDVAAQIASLRDWVVEIRQGGTPLFICDGNHDFNSSAIPLPEPSGKFSEGLEKFVERAQRSEHWMDALVDEGAYVTAGRTQAFAELEGLIVTSLLWGSLNDDANRLLLEEGSFLRRASPRSPWIVLHHEPPLGELGDRDFSSLKIGEWVEEFQPKIVLCGHDHRSPALNGTCCQRIGMSWIFNPGHQKENAHPICIEIETTTMKFKWLR